MARVSASAVSHTDLNQRLRPVLDQARLEDSDSLWAGKLVEPDWVDPNYLMRIPAVASKAFLPQLRSIYTVGRSHRRLKSFSSVSRTVPSPDPSALIQNITRDFVVSFDDNISIHKHIIDCNGNQPPWKSVQDTHSKQRNRTEATIRESQSRWDRKSPSSSRRMAVARALSLAMLLGLPARTTFDTSLGRLIADTGCGKDIVSNITFTEYFMTRHCWKRDNPICMQTANGPVELDSESRFWLKKLKQKYNAVVGGDTPDLLPVGYRC